MEVIYVAIGYMQTGEHYYANGDQRSEYVFNNSKFLLQRRGGPVCLPPERPHTQLFCSFQQHY